VSEVNALKYLEPEHRVAWNIERSRCPVCGVLWNDIFVPDIRRHNFWHERLPLYRDTYGSFLLGPDELCEAHVESWQIMHDNECPLSLKIDAVILHLLVAYCVNIYTSQDIDSLPVFRDFDSYIRVHLRTKEEWYRRDLGVDGDAILRELRHRADDLQGFRFEPEVIVGAFFES